MNHSPKGLSRSRRGRALRFALVAVATLAVLGFAAYRFLANRPGEAATALIPADADVVITLDTNPSQRQLAAFLKITAALEKQGIAKKLDEMFSQALEGKPIAAEIQPHLQKSFAVAIWMDEGKAADTVTLLSVDDPGAVKASLAAHGQKSSHGNYGIPGTNNAVFAMVVDAYLVLANSEATLARIERVRSGGEGSVLKLAAFNAARAALPVDANGMVFVSPRAFERLSKTPGGEALKATSWMAYSATVVPEGIQVDYQCPIDPAKMRALLRVPSIAPFDMGTLKMLPDGAYGVAAYSQVGHYWASASESLAKEPAVRDGFKDALSNFEKETGIGVARDLVPALAGEQILAIYPGDSGKLEDVDGLLVLTDEGGANPAALATKVRALIERKTAESGKGMKFVETKVGNATVWELDAASRKRIGEAGGMLGDLGLGPSPSRAEVTVPGGGMLGEFGQQVVSVRADRQFGADHELAGAGSARDRGAPVRQEPL